MLVTDGTEVGLGLTNAQVGVGVGPERPFDISADGSLRPALRTGRAILTASGSPRVYANDADDSFSMLVHGVGIRAPR